MSTSRSPLQRFLPISYAGLSVAVAALLLPSVLRPPQDQQSTTAAFSADAPPDDTPPDAIIQSVQEAGSSTAGAAVDQEIIVEETVIEAEAPAPVRVPVRAGCFGDPPRQTESLYSHLCVPAFTGDDNGGATHRGVTAEEIRVGVGVPADLNVAEGPLPRQFSPLDNQYTRLLKVWQTYFNDRFEFYGRYMQFYVFTMSSTSEDQAQGAARDAASRHGGMFAFMQESGVTTGVATNELVRQQVLTFTHNFNPAEFYRDAHPYAYSFDMDSRRSRAIGAELLCKQWVGKPPGDLNDRRDLTFDYGAPRRFGLIVYQDQLRVGAIEQYEQELAKCGERFVATQATTLETGSADVAGVAQAIAKMRQNGVTTIVLSGDPISPAILTAEATRLAYFPEWVCVVNCEFNEVGRILDEEQASAFVAVGFGEIPRSSIDKDWYRAFKEVDPEGVPAFEYFREIQQLAGGIQHAGPNLTPQSFWQGLRSQPCREPVPAWSIGGCYRDPDPSSEYGVLGDYTYSDYASLLWFDLEGADPDATSPGAWCWMDEGRRYAVGGLPAEPIPFRDPSRCIFTPDRGQLG